MSITSSADWAARDCLVQDWYRRELRARSGAYVAKWARALQVPESRHGIKSMRTKWGSCNPETGRIWLNLFLERKPISAIDYVVLHDMAHFISPRHDDVFVATMDRGMLGWRQVRVDLNDLPLGSWE